MVVGKSHGRRPSAPFLAILTITDLGWMGDAAVFFFLVLCSPAAPPSIPRTAVYPCDSNFPPQNHHTAKLKAMRIREKAPLSLALSLCVFLLCQHEGPPERKQA